MIYSDNCLIVYLSVGNLFAQSKASIALQSDITTKSSAFLKSGNAPTVTSVPVWQQWSKKVNAATLATGVLLMNNGFFTKEITLRFSDVPAFKGLPSSQKYFLRCLYGHKVVFSLHDMFFCPG